MFRPRPRRIAPALLTVAFITIGPAVGSASACPVEVNPGETSGHCVEVTLYIDDPPPSVELCEPWV
ncbi:MAG: hypothetical protein QOF60_187 [Actinomycetota bacterium]|jgi:hypothetical protein|nr:hypothetical protein [Actinomycetota bacterium]